MQQLPHVMDGPGSDLPDLWTHAPCIANRRGNTMTRTTINPRCPYCGVRHSTSTTWRCKERDEGDKTLGADQPDHNAECPALWNGVPTSCTCFYTCPTSCMETNHPGREHIDWEDSDDVQA